MNEDEKQKGFFRLTETLVPTLLGALLINGVVAWSDLRVLAGSVKELRDSYVTDIATLAAIAEQAHANTIHRVEHERQAERYIAKIEANERAIIELRTNSKSRPDPFTGTEGRALRDRIEKLERQD
jgi:hypothetical protein